MATEMQRIGRKTPGSLAILIHGRLLRNRAGVLPQTLLIGVSVPFVQEEQAVAPIQTAGSSKQSECIGEYLHSALADYDDLGSESPRRIRMTSSPKARVAQMDPWKAKNGRRIRLIKKKYREKTLTDKEVAELDRLNIEVSEHINHVSPRSTEALDDFAEFVSQLRAEVEKKRQQP